MIVLLFVRFWYKLILSISFRVISLTLGQSYDCPSASEAALKDRGTVHSPHGSLKTHDNITTKHTRTMCIFRNTMQIAKTPRSSSISHPSHNFVEDLYLIEVDPNVCYLVIHQPGLVGAAVCSAVPLTAGCRSPGRHVWQLTWPVLPDDAQPLNALRPRCRSGSGLWVSRSHPADPWWNGKVGPWYIAVLLCGQLFFYQSLTMYTL